MIPVLTALEMRALDRAAIDELGLPALVLMEAAGRAVADHLHRLWPGGRVTAVAGLGNNGGDAVVAARHLSSLGHDVEVVLAGPRDRVSKDLGVQLAIAEKLGLPTRVLSESSVDEVLGSALSRSSVALDGLFGTGLTRPVEGLSRQVVDLLNGWGGPVVAIDLPSGIDADTGQVLGTAVRAHGTVSFQCAKLGHYTYPGRAHTGVLKVVDIGIPAELVNRLGARADLICDDDLATWRRPRARDAHKGGFGHLLVVAGTPERPGSALLAGRAALRAGAGLVTIGSDRETVARIAPALDELMGLGVGVDRPEAFLVLSALSSRSALAMGPSLPETEETKHLVRAVLEAAAVPVVLDAGALSALGPDPAWLAKRKGPVVLTPHPGEMARMIGMSVAEVQRDRVGLARSYAQTSGAVVVLKGASTVVAEPSGHVGLVSSGNPGMATGGTGDVLTGIIGGLLAQGVGPAVAARVGAELHGRAGDRAAARGEARLIASDLLAEIGVLP